MNTMEKIPATIVTGFLGAGKTTLISKMIGKVNGERLALIVNEFGDLGFDGGQIASCGVPGCDDDSVIELTNGCICCTVADDFLPAMEALMACDPAPDHIIIETSGLALPQPLVQAFQWPTVKNRLTVDGVIAVVDGDALADGRIAGDLEALEAQRRADPSLGHDNPMEELFEDQLRCADLIVMSKADLIPADKRLLVAERVRRDARDAVKIVEAVKGDIPLDVFLGIEAAAEADMADRGEHHHHHDHDDGDDDHHHDHGHDAFESFVVPLGSVGSIDEMRLRVGTTMAMNGVLRIKGKASVAGKVAPAIVQAVGPRVETYFAPAIADRAESGVVVIGLAGMDHDLIAAALKG